MDQYVRNNKDNKIMLTILENARIPLSELEKKTKLSREVLNYRLKKLEKSLIIGYEARLNLKYFVNNSYTLYMNILGLSDEEVLKRLTNTKAHWYGHGGGRWNFILTFSTVESNDLSMFLNNLYKIFSDAKIKILIVQHLKEYKDTHGGLFGSTILIPSEIDVKQKLMLDDKDKKIIRLLANNARQSNQQIAEKIGMTRESVRQRIKLLEHHKVIINYRTIIKPSVLGLGNFFLNIKCKDMKVHHIAEYFSQIKKCIYLCSTIGEVNMIAELYCESFSELNDICSEVRKKFADILEEIEPIPLLDLDVHSYSKIFQ